ncbi:MAG: hypothetical protein ABR511_12005 [Acidimicrobiales bacterium]
MAALPDPRHRRLPALVAGALVVLLLAVATGVAVARAGRSARSSAPRAAAPPTMAGPAVPGTTATTTTVLPEPGYITEIKQQVAGLRGLAWKRPLAVAVVSKDELARRYRAGTERDAKPDRLAGDGDTFHLLHLVPRDVDYAKTVEDLYSGLVLGFYDPETKELVVGDSGGQVDAGTKVTLAHELDHALTDQWFDFGAATKALDDADREEEVDAYDALIEGDAKRLESVYADTYLSEEEQLAYALGGLGGGDDALAAKLAKTPKFLLDYLYFPYTSGLDFVKAEAATRGNAGVDDAYRRPPTSTEQILHPDLYAAAQGWTPPSLPDLATATTCQVTRRNALGEFKMEELLGSELGSSAATAAAAGWNGDAFETVRCGSALGMVERWQADSEAAATRLAAALARWGPAWSKGRASGGRFSGSAGTGRVVQSGARVDLVLADDAATADRLAGLS